MANVYIQGLVDDADDAVEAVGVEVTGEALAGAVIAGESHVVVSREVTQDKAGSSSDILKDRLDLVASTMTKLGSATQMSLSEVGGAITGVLEEKCSNLYTVLIDR